MLSNRAAFEARKLCGGLSNGNAMRELDAGAFKASLPEAAKGLGGFRALRLTPSAFWGRNPPQVPHAFPSQKLRSSKNRLGIVRDAGAHQRFPLPLVIRWTSPDLSVHVYILPSHVFEQPR